MTAPGPGSDQVTSRCYRHPEREALIRCTRCERPICPDCMRPASVGFHCPDDVRAGVASVRAPRTAVGARLLDSPPYVTIVLVVLNLAVYVITAVQSVGGFTRPTSSSLFYDWQLFPAAIHGQDHYYQLLTSAFLHVSPLHLLSNMLALAIIGPPLEELLGRGRYLALYLLGALGGSVAEYAFGQAFSFTVGASGAVFGLFAAALPLVRKLGLDLQWLVGIVVINFVLTFSIPGISKLGHIGGFVAGLLVAVALAGRPNNPRRVEPRIQTIGVGGVTLLLVVIVAIRTLTW